MRKTVNFFVKISFFAVAAALILTFLTNTSYAAAAVKAGDSCTKIGKTIKVKNKTFSCVLKNRKKIWIIQENKTSVKEDTTESLYRPDPVIARLHARMPSLAEPNFEKQPPPVDFILEDPGQVRHVAVLEKQFLYLAQAYPEFSWTGTGVVLMPKTEEWLIRKMTELGCHDQAINWSRNGFHEGMVVWGKGAIECSQAEGPVAIIANTGPDNFDSEVGWNMIVSGEFSGIILENRFASNQLSSDVGRPLRYFNVNMPVWMREGVELAFHSVAQAKQTGVWGFYSVDHRKTCGSEKLSDYSSFTTDPTGCHYILGYAANELLLALYGWDAPERWFSSFNGQLDAYTAFKYAYGEEYVVFEKYVTEFVRFRAYGEPMSDELLAKLQY